MQLFNLNQDLAETIDLSTRQPQLADTLKKRLQGYLTKVNAQLPVPNPNYDSAHANSFGKEGAPAEAE